MKSTTIAVPKTEHATILKYCQKNGMSISEFIIAAAKLAMKRKLTITTVKTIEVEE